MTGGLGNNGTSGDNPNYYIIEICQNTEDLSVHIPFVRMVILSPSGLTYPPSRFLSYTPSMLICSIRLLCDWWFPFYQHITYICSFVVTYLFSLWYDWFLWRCFMLLLGEILFSLLKFPFLCYVLLFWCEMLVISRLKRP